MLSKKAGLDIPKMNECMNSGRGKDAAKLDVAIGNALGVRGTPTFFINGEELQGNWTRVETWDGVLASYAHSTAIKTPADTLIVRRK